MHEAACGGAAALSPRLTGSQHLPPTPSLLCLLRRCADEIRESDIGTGAGLFEVRKIGDEFFTFIVDCKVGSWHGVV